MQHELDNLISRRSFLAATGLGAASVLSTGCIKITAEESSVDDAETSPDQEEQNPMSLIGAYHPLTGMSDPQDYSDDPGTIATAEHNLRESEADSDTKCIFVLAEVTPDDRENLKLQSENTVGGGHISGAKLIVDDTDDYLDSYAGNKKDWFELLTELGYHNGKTSETIYAGSEETYKEAFMFFVGNNDLENGQAAHITWGDLSLDFEMSQIQEVATPREMVAQLQG